MITLETTGFKEYQKEWTSAKLSEVDNLVDEYTFYQMEGLIRGYYRERLFLSIEIIPTVLNLWFWGVNKIDGHQTIIAHGYVSSYTEAFEQAQHAAFDHHVATIQANRLDSLNGKERDAESSSA